MRPLKIECANPNWRIILKTILQEGIEVHLLGLDYLTDWQFCETVSISHSMTTRIDTRNKTGKFGSIITGEQIRDVFNQTPKPKSQPSSPNDGHEQSRSPKSGLVRFR
jgi:hypothetical protein